MILLKKPYVYWVLLLSILYLFFIVYISKFYVSLWYLPAFASSVNWVDFFFSIASSISIAVLIGFNTVGSYLVYKQYTKRRSFLKNKGVKAASITGVGALVGTSAGICTACVGSLFPSFFGLFGITITLGALPFQGKEIQVGLIFILALSLYFIHKELKK